VAGARRANILQAADGGDGARRSHRPARDGAAEIDFCHALVARRRGWRGGVRRIDAKPPGVAIHAPPIQVDLPLIPERIVDLQNGALLRVRARGGRVGQRRWRCIGQAGRQVRRKVDTPRRHGVEHQFADADRVQRGAVRLPGRQHGPALQIVARAIHHEAIAIHREVAGARVELRFVEQHVASHPAAGLRDGEEALPCDGECERVFNLLDRALHGIGVVRPRFDRARHMQAHRRAGQPAGGVGVDALEADGLAVGDVVGDMAQRAGLCSQPADRGGHRAE
jgi:hypothetical protein